MARLVTDQDGNVIQGATRYYAYGREQTPGHLAGLPTDYTFTGQRQDNTGLIYMNARYYDPETGQFLSPDSEVPDATNVFDYNRYMYARGNPLKYNDPTGHCPICIGAAIGGIVTGATYALTTDSKDWNFTDAATVIGAGAIAGGLIGSGVGIAAGTVQMSTALAMASSAAVASGSGAIATEEAYMITNRIYDQKFDRSDFTVSASVAATEGAVNSLVSGSGLAAGTTRAAISAAFGAGDYLGRNYFNGTGDKTTASGAIGAGLLWGAGSATGDLFAGGFSEANPLVLRDSVTAKDWTPTIWLNKSLNNKLIWEGVQEKFNDTVRPTVRNIWGLVGWAVVDKEAQK